MNKKVIYFGATVGGLLGGWAGGAIDHSAFGLWGILLSLAGGLLGIYAAVKIQQ